ncbi:hypothetical protein FLONG3_4291 [Fusarium longipes]|uniref:Uncharacterized protein n=1 Tax=Fusarium longipes TaxID=694270 RepID=A0A395SYR8_9HYPO|nr:hypothetical protein FLONG3_4291 [Fusarium longipes]
MLSTDELLNPSEDPAVAGSSNNDNVVTQPERPEDPDEPNRPNKCWDCPRPAVEGMLRCASCIKKANNGQKKMRKEREAAGTCKTCGKPKDRVGSRCKKCNDAEKERQKKKDKEKRDAYNKNKDKK